VLVVLYVGLSLLRGSEKVPSLIGVSNCSSMYWVLELCIFALAVWFYRYNKESLDFWTAPTITLGEELFDRVDFLEENKGELIQKGFGAGIFSGFGLGGGVFLVPLFRHLRLNPLQATATCTFTIFVTATINCVQALLMGVLSPREFLFFFSISASGSYFLSVWISYFLRRAHRLSYVELLLVLLLMAANVSLPFSLWSKYAESGYDLNVILGFGSVC
jgi:hypothetical protein